MSYVSNMKYKFTNSNWNLWKWVDIFEMCVAWTLFVGFEIKAAIIGATDNTTREKFTLKMSTQFKN